MLNVSLSRREKLDRQRSRVATSARIYFRVGTRSCCARAALCFPSKSAFSIPDYFCVSFLLHLSSSTSSSSSAKCNPNTCLGPQLKEDWFIRSTALRQLLDHNSQFSASVSGVPPQEYGQWIFLLVPIPRGLAAESSVPASPPPHSLDLAANGICEMDPQLQTQRLGLL